MQVIIYFVVMVKSSGTRIWMNKLVADIELICCSQAAPGGGLLLVLVACKIIHGTFSEGKTITGLRSSAPIGCASLSRQDYPASRSQESLDMGLCLRSHITHIYGISLFETNYTFSYSKLMSSNKCQQVRKSRNGGWRKEEQPVKKGLLSMIFLASSVP